MHIPRSWPTTGMTIAGQALLAPARQSSTCGTLLTLAVWGLTLGGLAFLHVRRSQAAEPPAAAVPASNSLVSDGAAAGSSDVAEWFEREIRPLLAERCLSCHSSGLEEPKANLRLDRRDFVLAGGDSGPAIVPGKPTESLLLQAVRGEGLQMPPEKPLSPAEQRRLEHWITLGAPWPESNVATAASGPDWLVTRTGTHWAWQPLRDQVTPQPSDARWALRPLDAFIAQKLDDLGLQPATSAQPSVLLRRLAFDLTGLPPTPEQTLEFTTAADREHAYGRLVDRLLASPEFGVAWGRHWLDLVRYCETLGHEFDYPVRYAWQYRDAVIDALNADISYATFVREHIAGDLATDPRRHPTSGVNQSLALTGWWWMGEGLHAPVDVLSDEATRLDNQIDVYSKTFLAMTIACARCHDHKFDAIAAADYASLVGVLQSSRRTYAYDDSHGAIAAHNRSLAEQRSRWHDELVASNRKAQADEQAFEEWIERLVARLQQDPEERRKSFPVQHPLAPLVLLAESKDAGDFAARRQAMADQLADQLEAFETWAAASPKLADFSSGMPVGWYVETPDPRIAELAIDPLERLVAFDPLGILPARPGTFTSHVLGRQQQLSLRSPTFDLSLPVVALRMRGKSAQSTVFVDNYFMIEFHGLLFGDLRKPIDQPSDSGWVVHQGDLNKYIGHRAYLSIEDDENAWFELSEVRLSRSPPPPEPNRASWRLLMQPDLSADQLRRQMACALADTWSSVLDTPPDRAARPNSIEGDDRRDRSELLRSAIVESDRWQVALPVPRVDWEPMETLAARTPEPTRLIAIHEGTPRDARLSLRGNPHTPGQVVPRSDLHALGGQRFDRPGSSGRSELADSLTGGRHPLVARVIVNRTWLHLFGQGLVDSPDNFGLLGGAPSHAQLLDDLALRFMEHDWSIKWLVREICLSRAYRLASSGSTEQMEIDPAARMLSHRPVRRLSAEKLRDSMLAVSGSLDRSIGGPSLPVYLSEQMTGRGRPKASGPLDASGRRSAFIEIRRNFLDPFLVAFDQPPPATTVGKRNASNVPAQALSLLNDPLVHELANRWSQRLMADYAAPRQRVEAMFLTALARLPTERELAACIETLGDVALDGDFDSAQQPAQATQSTQATQATLASETARSMQAEQVRLAELAHVLLCTKEFQYLQ